MRSEVLKIRKSVAEMTAAARSLPHVETSTQSAYEMSLRERKS